MTKVTMWGAAAMVAALAMAGAAGADTVSGGSISLTGATDYYRQIGTLSKFNPASGNLLSISVTYGYGFNSTVTVSATTPSTGSVRTESAVNFQSSDAAVQSVFNSKVNTVGAASIGAGQLNPTAYDRLGATASYNLGAGQSAQFASNAAATSTTVTFSDASSLDAFKASGGNPTFDVYGQTLTGLQLNSTGGSSSASQATTATQTISILYTYATTPEPATWSLMILGFGVVGAALRRQRRGMPAAA